MVGEDQYKRKFHITTYSTLCVLILLSFIDSNFPGDFNLVEYFYWLAGISIPIITFVSVYFIIRTFNLQKEQLNTQQLEANNMLEQVSTQSQIMSVQRFESTFFLLLEKLYDRYSRKDKRDFFKKLHQLDREVEKELKSIQVPADLSYVYTDEYNKDVYRALCDAHLNLEHDFNLGAIDSYFTQVMKLLIRSQSFLEEDEVKYYFNFIVLELNPHLRFLLLYLVFVYDFDDIIKFIYKYDLEYSFYSPSSPIALTKGQSIWEYVVKYTGNLDPYNIKELIE